MDDDGLLDCQLLSRGLIPTPIPFKFDGAGMGSAIAGHIFVGEGSFLGGESLLDHEHLLLE